MGIELNILYLKSYKMKNTWLHSGTDAKQIKESVLRLGQRGVTSPYQEEKSAHWNE